MCGIVGLFSPVALNNTEIDAFKSLLAADIIRGSHATGVIKVNTMTNTVATHKRALDAYDFLAEAGTKEFLDKERGNILIGHNRYATMGDKADHANAHPFQEGPITMVHNGGQSSYSLELLEGHKELAVDSHMVARTIATHGIKKAVTEHLDGAFTLVWYNSEERTLNFIRNAERPLWLAKVNGNLVWASEKPMLDLLWARAGTRTTKYTDTPIELPINTLVTFKFDAAGKCLGGKPHTEGMVFLDLPLPVSWGSWANEYYGSQYQSSANTRTPNAADVTNFDARDKARVNKFLRDAGVNLHKGDVLTVDITSVEPYGSDPEFCKIVGVDRQTQSVVQVWGLVCAELTGITVVRCTLINAYELLNKGVKGLVITADSAGVSYMDSKFTMKTPLRFTLQHEVLKKKQQRQAISYPFKAQGHTFKSDIEFEDFVCQGCSICGTVPSAYDRRNNKLSVVAGNSFGGLLKDCEFICGKCEEEGA